MKSQAGDVAFEGERIFLGERQEEGWGEGGILGDQWQERRWEKKVWVPGDYSKMCRVGDRNAERRACDREKSQTHSNSSSWSVENKKQETCCCFILYVAIQNVSWKWNQLSKKQF